MKIKLRKCGCQEYVKSLNQDVASGIFDVVSTELKAFCGTLLNVFMKSGNL